MERGIESLERFQTAPFWQQFAWRVLDLLGISGEEVKKVVIEIEPGKLPKIFITRNLYTDRECVSVFEVFEGVKWEKTNAAPLGTGDKR